MNPYTSIWTGVAEGDGPRDFHLVLLDAGRSKALADPEGRSALHCIKCSACMNVCPVFERTGGHAYESTYPGPIGAILSPQLAGMADHTTLPWASSLCGACYEVCPVKIDIPSVLIHLRQKVVAQGDGPAAERLAMEAVGRIFNSRRASTSGRRRPPGLGTSGRRSCSRGGPITATCPIRPGRRSGSGGVSEAREEILRRVREATGDVDGGSAATWDADADASYDRDPPGDGDMPGLLAQRDRGLQGHGDPRGGRGRRGQAVAEIAARHGATRLAIARGLEPEWCPGLAGAGRGARAVRGGAGRRGRCDHRLPRWPSPRRAPSCLDGGPGQGPRRLTLVPDLHVCIVLTGQIVPGVPQAVAALRDAAAGGRPLTFVSGPSATSDIELDRVEGVHGPRRLEVVLVG